MAGKRSEKYNKLKGFSGGKGTVSVAYKNPETGEEKFEEIGTVSSLKFKILKPRKKDRLIDAKIKGGSPLRLMNIEDVTNESEKPNGETN